VGHCALALIVGANLTKLDDFTRSADEQSAMLFMNQSLTYSVLWIRRLCSRI